ncbi:MAG: hypothetical protein NZM43_00810 [Saprospiraceae bacterium]|nr:hypothetical protein [Saprospiraceae bacterium]MDW8482838.1 hypothetical protein [Saprospiraceae bacterium]
MSLLQRWVAFLTALWYLSYHQLCGEGWIRFQSARQWRPMLSPQQERRCRHYFRGALFLGAIFAAQRGSLMCAAERRQFARLAALAALFDDTVEQAGRIICTQPLEEAEMSTWHKRRSAQGLHSTPLFPLHTFAHQADPGGTLLFFLKKIRAKLLDATAILFEKTLLKVFQLEIHGLACSNVLQNSNKAVEVAIEKGAYSALLFRLLLDPPPSAAERRLAMALGAFVQACDDIFDLWHDAHHHLYTPARWWAEAGRLEQVSRHLDGLWKSLAQASLNAPAASQRARHAALVLAGLLGLLTRFCLHHYHRLLKKHGTLPWHDRRAMVLDMARWSTRLRAFFFACRNNFFPT